MLEELQRRNYSQATTRGYILAVKQFAEYFGMSPEKLGAGEIRRYQLYLLNEKKLAPGTVEIRMSALRFLYKKTLKRRDLSFVWQCPRCHGPMSVLERLTATQLLDTEWRQKCILDSS